MGLMQDIFERPIVTKIGVQADVLRRPTEKPPEQAAEPPQPGKPEDSHEARIDALAEVLGGLFGEKALAFFPSKTAPVTKALKGLGAKPAATPKMASPFQRKRQEGEKWKGPSGRTFVMRNGRAVPAKGTAKDTATKLGNGQARLSREDAHGAVSAIIDQIKAGDMTPEARGRLGEHLEHLRVDQLRALADKNQLFCPPKLKAQLVAKLHEHLLPAEIAHGDDIIDRSKHADKLNGNGAFTDDGQNSTLGAELHRSANPPQAKTQEPDDDFKFDFDAPPPAKKETPEEWLERYDRELEERNKPKPTEEKPTAAAEKPMESPLRNPWSAPLTVDSGLKLFEALKGVEGKADRKYKFGAIRTTSKPTLQGMAAKLGVSGEGTRLDIADAIFDHLLKSQGKP